MLISTYCCALLFASQCAGFGRGAAVNNKAVDPGALSGHGCKAARRQIRDEAFLNDGRRYFANDWAMK
jgi:hypothetical protein